MTKVSKQCRGAGLGLVAAGGALLLSGLLARAQEPAPARTLSGEAINAADIVRNASFNELHSGGFGKGHPFRYRLHKIDGKVDTVKEIVETKDGDVARLIEKNGKPLSPEDDRLELDRLNELLAHPDVQARRHKKEQEDSGRADEMVRLLPDAFVYHYEGMVQGPSGPAYRLSFKPNSNFTPPDREAEVYHGMEGELWVDQAHQRLAKLDAHLFADVNFGWGVLGRLYKGGSILVENADVGHDHWETIHMKLNLTGKILMMKSVAYITTEDASDFHAVPVDIGYQDAIRMLEKPSDAQLARTGER